MATNSTFAITQEQSTQLKNLGAFDKVQAYMKTLGIDLVVPVTDIEALQADNARKGFEGKRFLR